jgi:hypothetical protein
MFLSHLQLLLLCLLFALHLLSLLHLLTLLHHILFYTFIPIFRRLRKIAKEKGYFFVMSVHPTVHLSERNNSGSHWWNLNEIDIEGFFENLSRKFKFH